MRRFNLNKKIICFENENDDKPCLATCNAFKTFDKKNLQKGAQTPIAFEK